LNQHNGDDAPQEATHFSGMRMGVTRRCAAALVGY
jgi:hypothetical protein